MSPRGDRIRLLLLDMITSKRDIDLDFMARLTSQDWAALQRMARQHRLEPLLHRNSKSHPSWPVPESIIDRWQRAFRKSAMRAMAWERVLSHVSGRLDAAGIPYAALKGAWLARFAYPYPALRPLRDIDILVPPEYAVKAFEILAGEGFAPRSLAEPPIGHALAHGKHLPGLVSPGDKIGIEIHHRLFTDGHRALATQDVISHRVFAGSTSRTVAYLDPTDTLLHLIVHAAYEHEFCNGPLVLTDVAYLLGKAEVAWDRFWAEAARGGWEEGCNLLLRAVECYHGTRIARPQSIKPVPGSLVETAVLLMLQDHQRRGRVALLSAFSTAKGVGAKLRLAARRAKPEPHALAGFGGGKLAWTAYPHWMTSRLRQMLAALADTGARADIGRARIVKNWLGTRA
ncbi:MAG: nucleotidyltransferase family protein [Hyphomicrobiales bacterium]